MKTDEQKAIAKAKALSKTTVLIDKGLLKELKILALQTDTTVKALVEQAIIEKVNRDR
jgi:predicted transcriptional regulator